ncbi:hypothetical protein OUZ56_022637 [Daphnia magna]|uniref:Uncharacterized protein n=1 Tax=Daphnia magna TaxID=35525 RepID=A0ABR0AXA0_9CRUS|nr:hypothetical protein OUZ56_022637 [Daphnia magna]
MTGELDDVKDQQLSRWWYRKLFEARANHGPNGRINFQSTESHFGFRTILLSIAILVDIRKSVTNHTYTAVNTLQSGRSDMHIPHFHKRIYSCMGSTISRTLTEENKPIKKQNFGENRNIKLSAKIKRNRIKPPSNIYVGITKHEFRYRPIGIGPMTVACVRNIDLSQQATQPLYSSATSD